MSSLGTDRSPSSTTQAYTSSGYVYSQLYKGVIVKIVVARDKIQLFCGEERQNNKILSSFLYPLVFKSLNEKR